MSQSFNVVLSGPLLDVFGSIFALFRDLEPLGFRHDGSIVRIEESEEEISVPFEAQSAKLVADWMGAAASFSTRGITLDVIVTRWDSFSNVDIETGEGILRRAYQEGRFAAYLLALAAIATTCRAAGGTGGYDFNPDPISPEHIMGTITNNPENPGYPSDLGIVSRSGVPRNVIERLSQSFRIQETTEYWLLVGCELEELLRRPV
ncbi:MAG: hypothetical protein WBQ94_12015 [Terracidiphilus sp.]